MSNGLRRSVLLFTFFILFISAFFCQGCAVSDYASIKFMFERAKLPDAQIHKDMAYENGSDQDPVKHRLDLFIPEGKNFPVLIFVHGGGWNSGDKAQSYGGNDLYGNIGRFYAAHGIGTAVINYRLLPTVHWRDQIRDVARATAWVYRHIAEYGGDPRSLYLSGHSAGAQLAARVALDPAPLKELGLTKRIVKGVIGLSGAGYEIPETSRRSETIKRDYYAKRFADGDETGAWADQVSLLQFVDADSPPFLLFYAGAESPNLQRQTRLLAAALEKARVSHEVHIVPHRDHVQIVLTMSRKGSDTSHLIEDFIRRHQS